MSVNKLGIILFSSFLIFATAPLASAQSTQDQTQDQTKKTQKGTAKKETGKTTTDKNAPAAENKAGTTEKTKTETGKTGTKKAKKTSSLSTDKVREAQMSLKNEGFDPGPIDGVMGSMTMAALRNYQSHNKLKVTGTLTAETESALLHGNRTDQTSQSFGAASEPAATSVEDVKQIQQALTDLSYNPGDV